MKPASEERAQIVEDAMRDLDLEVQRVSYSPLELRVFDPGGEQSPFGWSRGTLTWMFTLVIPRERGIDRIVIWQEWRPGAAREALERVGLDNWTMTYGEYEKEFYLEGGKLYEPPDSRD